MRTVDADGHERPSATAKISSLGAGEARIVGMKSSSTDKIKGKATEAKGAVKEKLGRATNNPDTEASGTAEKAGGKVRNKVGDIKKVFGK
jgi:uncharacterized protein YjbJ (UPF0337 family)